MANRALYYFYAPTWDFPRDGPIKLGNVLTSPHKPELPLYTHSLPESSDIFSSEKKYVQFSGEKFREGKFSILTRFLSLLGVGLEAGVDWTSSHKELYKFERIETIQFFPTPEYIQGCIESDVVRRYLEKSRYRKPLYIITGLKIVSGARAKSSQDEAIGGSLSLDVDGTIWSGGIAPISIGPAVEGKARTKKGVSWDESSDFVLAFRLRKILVSKKSGTTRKDEDYKSGAMLEENGETRAVEKLAIRLEQELSAEDEGLDSEEVLEGDTLVKMAISTRPVGEAVHE